MFSSIKNQDQNELLFDILVKAKSSCRADNIDAINSSSYFPIIRKRASQIFSLWIRPRKPFKVDPKLLNANDLKMNMNALSIAITEYMQGQNTQSFCSDAIQKIYARKTYFASNTQIYKKYDDKLKVSDLLEIIGYALEAAKQFCNFDAEELERGLLVLKSVDLALNNKPYDRPELKATHLAVDILSSLLQCMESNPEAKRRISGGAKMVQLAISFFTGRDDDKYSFSGEIFPPLFPPD